MIPLDDRRYYYPPLHPGTKIFKKHEIPYVRIADKYLISEISLNKIVSKIVNNHPSISWLTPS